MFKIKTALATASAGALVALAAVSLHADGTKRMPDPTTFTRIDTLDLMSKARDLPSLTVESPI